MKIEENLNYTRPFISSDSNLFVRDLKSHFDHYLKDAFELVEKRFPDSTDIISEELKLTCSSIIETLEQFFRGSKIKSSNSLNNCLDYLNNRNYFDLIQNRNSITDQTTLFRARPDNFEMNESSSEANILELFHVPFQLRHRVNCGRLNSAGIPLMYCSNDLFTALIEADIKSVTPIDKNDSNFLNFAKFTKLSSPVNQIDFSYKDWTELLNSEHLMSDSILRSYIVLYPIVVALHAQTTYKKGYPLFKLEYYVSNLLVDWFSHAIIQDDNGLSLYFNFCIKYNSVKNFKENIFNYAFFPKVWGSSGYCDSLQELFLRKNGFSYVQHSSELLKAYRTKLITPENCLIFNKMI